MSSENSNKFYSPAVEGADCSIADEASETEAKLSG